MMSFAPLWKTLKEKNLSPYKPDTQETIFSHINNLSTYKLINEYGISKGTIDNLKHNRNVTLLTVEQLCHILDCKVEDIVVYIKDN